MLLPGSKCHPTQTSQLAVWNEALVQRQRNHQGVKLAAVHSEIQHAISRSSQEPPAMQDTSQI